MARRWACSTARYEQNGYPIVCGVCVCRLGATPTYIISIWDRVECRGYVQLV